MNDSSIEIRQTTMDDIVAFRKLQGEAWLETYPSPEYGVSEDWVKTIVDERFSDKGMERSKEFIAAVLADSSQMHRVAVKNGEVIGFVHVATCEDGSRELKAIYVSPALFGIGVGAELMKVADQWMNGARSWLSVAVYNKRAIRFYEKSGFKLVPGSESVYKEVIPVVTMEREAKNQSTITIRPTTSEDIKPLRKMHAQSWLETYPNDDGGVPWEWVRDETDSWLTEEGIAKSYEHFKDKLGSPDHFHHIAVDGSNGVVGFVHGSKLSGHQRLEGLYLLSEMQGTGLAQQMVDELMEWFDPTKDIELEVIDYNEHAKRFYRKYGFEEVKGSNELFKGKIPSVTMIRKGDKR